MNKQNKQRFTDLYLTDMRLRSPSFPVEFIPPPNLKEAGANDLTRLIVNFINLSGYQAERISTTGRMIDQSKTVTDILGRERKIGSSKYIKGTSTRGSADISATIRGRSIKIEVKWAKDRQSEVQKQYEQNIVKAGGVYYIARTFDEFIVFFDSLNFQDTLL